MELFYRTRTDRSPSVEAQLPTLAYERDEASSYVAGPELVDAVNTALLLGKPLLVTGEPGCGKTQLAASIAWQLGFGSPLTFVTKSTSQASDLFYSYDAVARFKASERQHAIVDFVRYNALGQAILYANPPDAVSELMPAAIDHPGVRRSVVLIDEVDKAPRDFPNDILTEIENMKFVVHELGKTVQAPSERRPVVIITSNSERGLPDAFLRRCIYYDIPFPDRQRLDEILQLKLRSAYDSGFAELALEVFDALRSETTRLIKKPSTAELLGWMNALLGFAAHAESASAEARRNPLLERKLALRTLGVLIKSRDDLEQAKQVIENWIRGG